MANLCLSSNTIHLVGIDDKIRPKEPRSRDGEIFSAALGYSTSRVLRMLLRLGRHPPVGWGLRTVVDAILSSVDEMSMFPNSLGSNRGDILLITPRRSEG